MNVPQEFGITDIPEVDWPAAWQGYSLTRKIRWFELRARVEEGVVRSRQNSYLYAAVAAICKGGNCTTAWCESRIRQMAEMHGIAVDKTIVTPPVLWVLFAEFVDKA